MCKGFTSLTLISLLFFSNLAAERKPIFQELKVKEIFNEHVTDETEDGISMLKAPIKEEELLLEEQPEAQTREPIAKDLAITDSDSIVNKYGNPEERFAVHAQDTAPAPYKAMLEAIRIGDKKLAYSYAKQYVKYLKDVQDFTKEAVKASGYAQVSEGMLPTDSWVTDPDFKDKDYLAMLAREKEEESHSRNITLSAGALRDFEQTKEADRLIKSLKGESEKLDETTERNLARVKSADKLVRAVDGKVDVYFFLALNDDKTANIAGDVSEIISKYKDRSNIKITVVSLQAANSLDIKIFQEKTKTDFNLSDGSKLASSLGIKNSSIVLMASSTGESYLDEGVRNFYYWDELIKLMAGKTL